MRRKSRLLPSSYFLAAFFSGAGYNMDAGAWRLVPSLALEYLYHDEDGFAESGAGAFNLIVDSYDEDSFTSRLGLKLARVFDLQKVKIVVRNALEYIQDHYYYPVRAKRKPAAVDYDRGHYDANPGNLKIAPVPVCTQSAHSTTSTEKNLVNLYLSWNSAHR